MSQYNRMVRYWNVHPPTHRLVAGIFTAPKEGVVSEKTHTADQMASEFAEILGSGSVIRGRMEVPNGE